ncbi:MAG: hypothetical protein COA42_02605 [Alteromonadaceae bacterium]|nr:MAG: hypothetical protein COA42_02605 [Alteromonadaceae bacterium]
MGHRSLIVFISFFLSLASVQSLALGLGKITLHSKLNQALDAEVKLLEVRDLVASEILVGLASRDDFQRYGVDKTYFLSDLRFKVDLEASGGPVLRVSSRKLVKEPFLNFLLEVQWPTGRIFREYTVLLDLPVFSDEPSRPVQATNSRSNTPSNPSNRPAPQTATRRSSSSRPSSSRPSSRPRAAKTQAVAGDTYLVEANDTLWDIAVDIRPDRSVSIRNAMLAIQQANPDAFINNNINLLKRGQVLRLPDAEAMSSFREQDSYAESAPTEDGEGAQLEGSRAYDSRRDTATGKSGRVKLASATDTSNSESGRSGGSGNDAGAEGLENELAITNEQLDKSSRDNAELREQVKSLEEQISTMKRMIELSDDNLRAMELAAVKNAEEKQKALDELALQAEADDVVEGSIPREEKKRDPLNGGVLSDGILDDSSDLAGADESADPSTDVTSGDLAEVTQTDDLSASDESLAKARPKATATPQTVEKPAKKASDKRNRVVKKPVVKEPSIVDMLMENLLFVVAGLGVLIAAVVGGLFFMRKKSDEDDEFEQMLADQSIDLGDDDGGLGDGHGSPEDDVDDVDDVNDVNDVDLDAEADLGLGLDGELPIDDSEEALAAEEQSVEEPAGSQPQTEDVVAEADIYIAYSKYDQAEEMLENALKNDIHDESVRLKLLEVYSNIQDTDKFDPHYAKLQAFASPDTIERASQLRANISDAGTFDAQGFDVSDVTAFAPKKAPLTPLTPEMIAEDTDGLSSQDDSLSLDLEIDGFDGAGDDSANLETELDFGDISLDEGLLSDEVNDLEVGSSASSAEQEEISLDLDLGLDDSRSDLSSDDEQLLSDLDDSAGQELALEVDSNDAEALSLGNESDELSLDMDNLDLELPDSAEGDDLSLDDDFELPDNLEIDLGAALEQDDAPDDKINLDLSDDFSLDEELELPKIGDDSASDDLSLDDELSLDIDLDGELSLDEFDSELGLTESPETGLKSEDLGGDAKPDSNLNDLDEDASLDDLDLGSLDLEGGLGDLDNELAGLGLDDAPAIDDDNELSLDDLDGDLSDLDSDLLAELDEPLSDLGAAPEEEQSDIDLDDELSLSDVVSSGDDVEVSNAAGDLDDEISIDTNLDDYLESLDEVLVEGDLSAKGDSNESDLEEDFDLEGLEELESLGDQLNDTEFDADLVDLDKAPAGDDLDSELESLDITELEGKDLGATVAKEQAASSDDLIDLDKDDILEFDSSVDLGELESALDDLDGLDSIGDTLGDGSDDSIPSLDDIADIDLDDDSLPVLGGDDVASLDELGELEEQPSPDAITELSDIVAAPLEEEPSSASNFEFELPEIDPEDGDDLDLDFLSDSDEIATKLDLARAYIDMGDIDGAKEIIHEVVNEGDEKQQSDAKALLTRIEI